MSDLESALLMGFVGSLMSDVGRSRPYTLRDATHTPTKAERAQLKARKDRNKKAKSSRKKNRH